MSAIASESTQRSSPTDIVQDDSPLLPCESVSIFDAGSSVYFDDNF
jgi:hypothetical protein